MNYFQNSHSSQVPPFFRVPKIYKNCKVGKKLALDPRETWRNYASLASSYETIETTLVLQITPCLNHPFRNLHIYTYFLETRIFGHLLDSLKMFIEKCSKSKCNLAQIKGCIYLLQHLFFRINVDLKSKLNQLFLPSESVDFGPQKATSQ